MDHDTREMLLETAGRFFAERCGKDIVNGVEKGVWPADLLEGDRGDGPAADRRARGQGRRRRHAGRPDGACCGWPARTPCRCRSPRPRSPTCWWPPPAARRRPAPRRSRWAISTLQRQPAHRQGRSRAVRRCRRPLRRGRQRPAASPSWSWSPRPTPRSTATPSHAGEPYGTVTFDKRRLRILRRLGGQRRARARARGAGARHADGGRGRQGAGDRRRILQAARAVRPVDLDLPGDPAHAGRAGELRRRHHRLGRGGVARRRRGRAGRRRQLLDRRRQDARPPTSPSASPPSRTSRWARWASPTSTSCITTRAGSGCGAATSAARASGARRSAPPFAKAGPQALWPSLTSSKYAA